MSVNGSGWQHNLNKMLSGLITIGDILLVLMQTLIVSFGAIVLMVLLLWVEQDAVSHGVATYETSTEKAAAAATVMVLFNFAVKFWEVYIESKATDQRKRFKPTVQYAFSLRTWFTGVQYFLGVGKKWKKEALPASAGFASVRKIITVAMLYMAFVGRTHEAIQKVSLSNGKPLAWSDGIKMLAEQSSLSDITLWLTATIFTFAAVIAAQRLTQYVAVRVIEIRRGLDVQKKAKIQTVGLSNKPTLAYETARGLTPIKVKVGSETRYKCPQCEKVMSRQGWQNHPCRFTELYASIDGVDAPIDRLTGVDLLIDSQAIRQPSSTTVKSVNGHSKDGVAIQ